MGHRLAVHLTAAAFETRVLGVCVCVGFLCYTFSFVVSDSASGLRFQCGVAFEMYVFFSRFFLLLSRGLRTRVSSLVCVRISCPT